MRRDDDPPIAGPARPGPTATRASNLALVLRTLERSPGSSRAGVAAATGLTRATVSSLVDTLAEWGLVQEAGRAPSSTGRTGAGRPGTAVELSPTGAAGLGVEVNVDYVATCVVDLTGTVRATTVRYAEQRGRAPEQVVLDAAEQASAELDRARSDGLRVVAAKIAVPGLVRPDGGVAVAPNLGWRDVPLADLLRRTGALGALPVTVDNEASCAALGELRATDRPATNGTEDLLYVSGEVGVGGAVVIDGAVLRGTRGWAGELGHVTVEPDGPPCSCGGRGCLEQYAGQEAILRAAGLPYEPTTAHAPAPSADRIVAALRADSPSMRRAVDAAATALGVALASALNLLDVPCVVLGGTLRTLEPWLRAPVERELTARVLARTGSSPTVRVATRGTDAAVVGAAATVVHEVIDDPAAWSALLANR